MPHQRGDIIEIAFLIPHNGKIENHPAVIISNQEVFDNDACYVCAMMTYSTVADRFTFEVTDNMLTKPHGKPMQVRYHLITYILPSQIISNVHNNKMKIYFVDRLVEHIMVATLRV